MPNARQIHIYTAQIIGNINSFLNNLSRSLSSSNPAKAIAPQVENGEQPVYKPGRETKANNKVGDKPVVAANEGTSKDNVGITTPSVAAKKLIMDAVNVSIYGAKVLLILAVIQADNNSTSPPSIAMLINMPMLQIIMIIEKGTL